MAVRNGLQADEHDAAGYLSDESDFYGDEATREDFETRALDFDVRQWWRNATPSLTQVANSNTAKAKVKAAATLYNPYEGQRCGRQLGETVEEFLHRLPPATTKQSFEIPWIFIANPFRKAIIQGIHEERTAEAPSDDKSDWAQFVVKGNHLLEELTGIRHSIEKKMSGRAKAAITKAINVEKDIMVRKILDAAIDLHCTSGKWMMFCQPDEVNAVWSVVTRATVHNDLGIAAKVAPDEGDTRTARLLCIYTKDFSDMGDVGRVIRKMKDLGLVDLRDRPLYYKCDAYTYLGLNSSNEWAIKASLYNSTDVLKAKGGKSKDQQKLEGFFYKKRKDEEDWRPLEWE